MDVSLPLIDLFQGWPSSDLLPIELIQEATLNLLGNPKLAHAALNYGPDPGSDSLRYELAQFLSTFYASSWTRSSRLTISGGASSALSTILQVYTDPSYTKAIYMVAPTYFLACRVFEDNGYAGRLRAIPEDDGGIDLRCLEEYLIQDEVRNGWVDTKSTKQPLQTQKHYKSVVYCVPTFSNPSGKTMSQHHREHFIRLARKHDVLIISDDVYDFLHWSPGYEGRSIMPRLVDIDHTLEGGPSTKFGNVVSNGSFSKILGPGLRTGWTESTTSFAEGLAQCGLICSGGSPSQFTACIIAESLRTQALQRHLFHRLSNVLRKRFEAALESVKVHLTPHGVSCSVLEHCKDSVRSKQPTVVVPGGYYIYIHLPHRINASQVASQSVSELHLMLGSGEKFEVHGDEAAAPCRNTIRICVAWETEERLTEGISRLGELLRMMLKSKSQGFEVTLQ